MPLPEHPRPDWLRADWVNLNGSWSFQFDGEDVGEDGGWQNGLPSPGTIMVPFPWGSPLSGVSDEAELARYERTIRVPADWADRRVFLVIGASDWRTTVWLDGERLGVHEGGYTPFEFELTDRVEPGDEHQLVVRVDDVARDFKLEGKQGYGNARGIWQTPYLEARGSQPLRSLHFSPDLANERVAVEASLLEPATEDLTLSLDFANAGIPQVVKTVPAGSKEVRFDVSIPDPRLWSLEDPHLYEVEARLAGEEGPADRVVTYFGMRSVSVVSLPGTSHRYVALNGEPIYLQLALDQAYHPEGYYTFPSDAFIRDDVLRARQIGLNGLRVHIKVPLPRKLYWADRLGMLVMADVPNSWGEPTPAMRAETEKALRGMIHRDFNHPSIFSWVVFNETWGLRHREGEEEVYRQETKEWVASMYRLTKSLDSTRLVEDNSVCCGVGHTETDLNSWHAYLPGWAWEETLSMMSDSTYPGSEWNFEDGWEQARQPNINSEFGNVWGYEGSTGDVDYTWDYHSAIEAFRRHPAIAGWLYTEHHDVINEWNGYWRYDRSEKITGLDALVDGMSLVDLHAPLYIAVGDELSKAVAPGVELEVPLFASFLTGKTGYGDELVLESELYGWDFLGRKKTYATDRRTIPYQPWMTGALEPLEVTTPNERAVAVLETRLLSSAGQVLHRNFTTLVVEADVPEQVETPEGGRAVLQPFSAAEFADASWSQRQWDVLDGLKVNGAGTGYFEYRVPWPEGVAPSSVRTVTFVAEVSAKQLFGKDRTDAADMEGDYMRGRGTFDPSRNPNSYPMTDGDRFPSAVVLRVNEVLAGRQGLADDPADHRGILSWHSQLRDRRLREAGSYGELVGIALPEEAVRRAAEAGEFVLRLEADEALAGGLALYGRNFGRFPLDPTLVFEMND